MGLMNRREFLFSGIQGRVFQRGTALQMEVMEVFSASNGSSALLVHHADEATREAFAEWLRANSSRQIVCLLPNGMRLGGRIFRVSLCFGRGLILLPGPIKAHAKEIVGIL